LKIPVGMPIKKSGKGRHFFKITSIPS